MSSAREYKPTIKSVDMAEDMQSAVIEIAQSALDKFSVEKDVAAMIKKELDAKFGLTWHCIVGKNFGSYVTHETKHFIYFYIGPLAFLAYKTS
ncbi:dynein light chain 1, cytoplasmic [Trichomonascus vanleenenianus]|uniref:dynein light chain n=1 Tax=Trichomonascus vanleenenianus TaxID=2268995 RepID=UPI003ECB4900